VQEIRKWLLPLDCESRRILVLQGKGGIGKSQMAQNWQGPIRMTTPPYSGPVQRLRNLRSRFCQIAERVPLPETLSANALVGNGAGEIAIAKNRCYVGLMSAITTFGS